MCKVSSFPGFVNKAQFMLVQPGEIKSKFKYWDALIDSANSKLSIPFARVRLYDYQTFDLSQNMNFKSSNPSE
jgi:hypothetical protein